MKTIRGLSGFGDTLYLRVVIEWLLCNRPDDYIVFSNYPDVFSDLRVHVKPFTKTGKFDYVFNYLIGKQCNHTTQFEDMIFSCDLPRNIELTSNLKTEAKRVNTVIVNLYRAMGGHNNSAMEMVPYEEDFKKIYEPYPNKIFIDKKISFNSLVNIFNSAKIVIAQNGWAIPMSEMLNIPNLICYTQRGLNSKIQFFNTITPNKILHKKTSKYVILN